MTSTAEHAAPRTLEPVCVHGGWRLGWVFEWREWTGERGWDWDADSDVTVYPTREGALAAVSARTRPSPPAADARPSPD